MKPVDLLIRQIGVLKQSLNTYKKILRGEDYDFDRSMVNGGEERLNKNIKDTKLLIKEYEEAINKLNNGN